MCSFSAHQSLADPVWEVYSPSSVGDHARRYILRLPANWQRPGSVFFNPGGHNILRTWPATPSGVPARNKAPISLSGASSHVVQDCSHPRRSTTPTPPRHPAPSGIQLLAQDSSATRTSLPVPHMPFAGRVYTSTHLPHEPHISVQCPLRSPSSPLHEAHRTRVPLTVIRDCPVRGT